MYLLHTRNGDCVTEKLHFLFYWILIYLNSHTWLLATILGDTGPDDMCAFPGSHVHGVLPLEPDSPGPNSGFVVPPEWAWTTYQIHLSHSFFNAAGIIIMLQIHCEDPIRKICKKSCYLINFSLLFWFSLRPYVRFIWFVYLNFCSS